MSKYVIALMVSLSFLAYGCRGCQDADQPESFVEKTEGQTPQKREKVEGQTPVEDYSTVEAFKEKQAQKEETPKENKRLVPGAAVSLSNRPVIDTTGYKGSTLDLNTKLTNNQKKAIWALKKIRESKPMYSKTSTPTTPPVKEGDLHRKPKRLKKGPTRHKKNK
jgi:hypothetical protein